MIGTIRTFIQRILSGFRREILPLPSRLGALIFCISLFLFPLIIDDPFIIRLLYLTNIFVIYAVSWDLLSGYTGQLSLGHAIFLGVGAYTAALLNLYYGLPPLVTIPLGALLALVVGMIVGPACLRLRGPYLAIATLAFPVILMNIFEVLDFTGGSRGTGAIGSISSLAPSSTHIYYYVLIIMLVSTFIMWKITDSRFGLIFHSIRENEITARSSGINTTQFKLLAFSVSAIFAGIAGGLYAHSVPGGTIGSSIFLPIMSFYPLIWTVFGGIGSIYGAIGGTFILYPLVRLLEMTAIPPQLPMVIYATLVIVILLFMREGVFHWIRDKIEEECPRCKERNSFTREECRSCGAPLKA